MVSSEQVLQTGDRAGSCRVIELIASGGLSYVYKVWDEEHEEVRALKILKSNFVEESGEKFKTEALIASSMQHQNIVKIYGTGHYRSVPFMKMEYVDGPSLKVQIKRMGQIPIEVTLSIVHFLCEALSLAHKNSLTVEGVTYQGLIHRDIKPANIMLTSSGVVKLADFGIALPAALCLRSPDSKISGTFAYLSPEQLNREELDHRCDIYALGTLIYEMLSGKKAFPQKQIPELFENICSGVYAPIEQIYPLELIAAVERCLSVEREKRFTDTEQLDSELVKILNLITRISPEEILWNFMQENSTIRS